MNSKSSLTIEWLKERQELLSSKEATRELVEFELFTNFDFEELWMFAEDLYCWWWTDLLDLLMSFTAVWSDSIFWQDSDKLLKIAQETPVTQLQDLVIEGLAKKKIDRRTTLKTLWKHRNTEAISKLLKCIVRDQQSPLDDLVSFRKTINALEKKQDVDFSKERDLLDEAIELSLCTSYPEEIEKVYKKVEKGGFSRDDFPERFHIFAPKLFPAIWDTQ